ncbi:hypothetical protein DFH09DRAFT_41867 [Mycena vulgaris]|nr:hypothetical protein DFH09DRAFT_41867 [Mycena vulgaris]
MSPPPTLPSSPLRPCTRPPRDGIAAVCAPCYSRPASSARSPRIRISSSTTLPRPFSAEPGPMSFPPGVRRRRGTARASSLMCTVRGGAFFRGRRAAVCLSCAGAAVYRGHDDERLFRGPCARWVSLAGRVGGESFVEVRGFFVRGVGCSASRAARAGALLNAVTARGGDGLLCSIDVVRAPDKLTTWMHSGELFGREADNWRHAWRAGAPLASLAGASSPSTRGASSRAAADPRIGATVDRRRACGKGRLSADATHLRIGGGRNLRRRDIHHGGDGALGLYPFVPQPSPFSEAANRRSRARRRMLWAAYRKLEGSLVQRPVTTALRARAPGPSSVEVCGIWAGVDERRAWGEGVCCASGNQRAQAFEGALGAYHVIPRVAVCPQARQAAVVRAERRYVRRGGPCPPEAGGIFMVVVREVAGVLLCRPARWETGRLCRSGVAAPTVSAYVVAARRSGG